VPTISRFHGIVITMFFNDHDPLHFHAWAAGREARFRFDRLEFMQGGDLGRRQRVLVEAWALLHREQLEENWRRARDHGTLKWIEPLR
jgi:hypothetical protein